MGDTILFAAAMALLLAFLGGIVAGRRQPRRRLR
jgi:hypothetical protein